MKAERALSSSYRCVQPEITPRPSFQEGDHLRWRRHAYAGFAFNHLSQLPGPELHQSKVHESLLVVVDTATPLSITSEKPGSMLVINPGLPVDDVTVAHDDSFVLIPQIERKNGLDVVKDKFILVGKDNPYKAGDDVKTVS